VVVRVWGESNYYLEQRGFLGQNCSKTYGLFLKEIKSTKTKQTRNQPHNKLVIIIIELGLDKYMLPNSISI
jgi:hypothetical protein